MARNPRRLLLFLACFVIIMSCSVSPSHCKKHQSQALSRLYKLKQNAGSNIDTSHFEGTLHVVGRSSRVNNLRENDQIGSKEEDRIIRLPGQPDNVEFMQYGGYVTVDESAGRAFYYYFVEAVKSKESLPLLLWLNGGPGCSSLAYGAMQELGPFRVHSDGKNIFRNKFSWNNAANVLFVESPAGVGFSYSNTSSDYKNMGDKNTAEDNYVFLINWLERFPEYKGRDFYISGESYAGHYVPQLAHTILLHTQKSKNPPQINLKGILIGNAVINDEMDLRGMYDFFESHGLITEESVERLGKSCGFSATGPAVESEECRAVSDEVENNIYYLDIYNIYAPICHNSTLTNRPKKATIMKFDPCSDDYVYAYMNRPEVQVAMHANVTKLSHDWEACSDIITAWLDSPTTVIPLLHELMAKGLRVWVFSGDTDGRVPVTSTKYSLKKMNLTTKTPWHPWYLGGEVGGYTQEYKGNLTFATVRGAGHQVPSYQPKRALSLIVHFLAGTSLPDTTRYPA